jgi:chromate transporter
MSDSTPPSVLSDASSSDRPTLAAIFRAFVGVSVSGFGGALPWARRMLVDKRGWMTAEEFNEAFSLSQFLPGPNTINFAVVFGARFGGAAGAALAVVGLLGPPLIIVTTLAVIYGRYGDVETLNRILSGIGAAAAGMLIAIAAKMIAPLLRKGLHWAPAVALIAFVCVALLQYPLPLVFLALAPFSIALAWFRG